MSLGTCVGPLGALESAAGTHQNLTLGRQGCAGATRSSPQCCSDSASDGKFASPMTPQVVIAGKRVPDSLPSQSIALRERPVREISNIVGLAAGMTAAAWTALGVQLVDKMLHSRAAACQGSDSSAPKWGWLHRAAVHASGHFQQRQSKRDLGSSHKLAATLLSKGIKYESELDILSARKCYEEAMNADPQNVDIISRLSKTWTDISYTPGFPVKDISPANQQALELAKQAIRIDPTNALGHIAACVSMGRLAMCSDNRQKVKLAFEAQEEASLALACDPNNDLAHHLQGRWHYEMAGINCVMRTLVRVMYGTALNSGSHKEAANYYVRAVELCPERLIHHVELGRCMMSMGMLREAQAKFEVGLSLKCEDINAHLTRKDAERMLEEVKRQLVLQEGIPTYA
eukprot:CAMPEP_0117684802 /NCGR_PEP_ID=MMETSP0804-20121206/21336_1 /TAXON_ID=1074897 /ORGANISM="Tetraselmis astigmatica, Strain CCMP880" /LENGTH=401 /DNA_ID=CAMNT_0005495903 /DNA_START=610 /DNA_END=1815 /DNA_ORIENTATION=+